jgi:hypothetical protein
VSGDVGAYWAAMAEQSLVRLQSDAEQFATRFRPPPSPLDGNIYFSTAADLFEPTEAQLNDCLREFSRLLTSALTPFDFARVLRLEQPVRIVRLYLHRAELTVQHWRRQDAPVDSLHVILQQLPVSFSNDFVASLRWLRFDLDVPTCDAVASGCATFEQTPLGIDYASALKDVAGAWPDSDQIAAAVKVFLDTCHQCDFGADPLVAWLNRHIDVIKTIRRRQIHTLSRTDRDVVLQLFWSLLDVLRAEKRSAIAVGQVLHLLAPTFMPFWTYETAHASGIASNAWIVGPFAAAEKIWNSCAYEYWHYTSRMKRYADGLAECSWVSDVTAEKTMLAILAAYTESQLTLR